MSIVFHFEQRIVIKLILSFCGRYLAVLLARNWDITHSKRAFP